MATLVVFVLAGALTWVIVRVLQRWANRREQIANCRHDLYLDKAQTWNATERCRRCPYQRPAREIQATYFTKERCPHCHKKLNEPPSTHGPEGRDEAEASGRP